MAEPDSQQVPADYPPDYSRWVITGERPASWPGTWPGPDQPQKAPTGLQLDLLTVIQRLEQVRDEAEMRAEALPWLLTGRVFACDIPRLRSHLTAETLAWEDAQPQYARVIKTQSHGAWPPPAD